MIKLLPALAFLGIIISCSSVKKVERKDLESLGQSIRMMAIIPFNVHFEGKRIANNTTDKPDDDFEERTGYEIQKNAFAWFALNEPQYSLKIQDIHLTNQLLNSAAEDYKGAPQSMMKELCDLLEVDAIIFGESRMYKPLSEGEAIVGGYRKRGHNPGKGTSVDMVLYNNKGDSLWRFKRTVLGDPESWRKFSPPVTSGISTGDIDLRQAGSMSHLNHIFKHAAKSFPFKGKK